MISKDRDVRIKLAQVVSKVRSRRLNCMHGTEIYPRRLFIVFLPKYRVIVHFRDKEDSLLAQDVKEVQADRERRETHSLINKNSVLELLALEQTILLADQRRQDKNIFLRHEEGVRHMDAARCTDR